MPTGAPNLRAVDLDDLPKAVPCRVCYPDAPRAKSNHLRCPKCNRGRPMPCPHNGGVPVVKTISYARTDYVIHTREDWEQVTFVWPENLRHHLVLPH